MQVLRCSLADEGDPTLITLVFSNRTAADIILREELETLAQMHPQRFTLHLMLSRPDESHSWPEENTGRVSVDCLRRQLPTAAEDVCVLYCGTPAFNATVKEGLTALHYHSGQSFCF